MTCSGADDRRARARRPPRGPARRRSLRRRGSGAAHRGAALRPGRPDRPLRPGLPVGAAGPRGDGAGRRAHQAPGAHALGLQGPRGQDLRFRRPQLLLLRPRRSAGRRAQPGRRAEHPVAAALGQGRHPGSVCRRARDASGRGAPAPAPHSAQAGARDRERHRRRGAVGPGPADPGRRRAGQPQPVPLRRHPGERGASRRALPVRGAAGSRGDPGMRRLPILMLVAAPLLGCATSAAFRAGEQAERRQDYDRAVVEYSKAVHEHPDDLTYRRGLERARLRASNEHATAARRLAGRGLYKEAADEYRLALDLNPRSPALESEMKELEARRQAGLRSVSLDEMKERTRERALPGLALGPAAREPLGLAFRGGSLREARPALGKAAGVNFVFDPQFQDQTISLDLRDVPFDQALNALGTTGRTFYRVVDAQIISVIPDTPTKRREYEQQVIKTLFLSNADLKETIDPLRVV